MPRRTVIPKSDYQRIEPDTSPEAWDFYRRHIVDPAIERVAFAIACVEEHRYRGNFGLWKEHWEWFVQSRGLGTCVDYSNQARWAEQAEAVSLLFKK